MKIGIPKEVKPKEGRVGLVPEAVADLVKLGHEVFVQSDAGLLSGYSDEDFASHGAHVLADAKAVYGEGDLIVKVKEPVASDLEWIEAKHTLFCYLHLAPNPELTQALLTSNCVAVAFETVMVNGHLPLLAPMSAIAGRVAVQAGAHYLHGSMGGKGLLMGGVPGADHGHVVVIGAGVAGMNAATMAANLGCKVTVFDTKQAALEHAVTVSSLITGKYAYSESIAKTVVDADLVIGAVLIPGAKAPHVVTEKMVDSMSDGSVIVDISIDQGGCVETIKPTTYENPTYEHLGVIHMGVTNMPGAVPRSASQALSGAILPFAKQLAAGKWQDDPILKTGVNVAKGKVVHPALLG